MAYADFESMLIKHSENTSNMQYNDFKEMKNGVFDSQVLTADKSASLF